MLKTVALVWCPMKDSINRRRHESVEVLFISFFGWNQKDLAESNRSMQSHVCSDLNVTSQPVSFVTQASREVKSLMICFLPSAERWLTCGDSKSWLILRPWPASWQIKGATWWHHDLFSFWLCACGCTGQRHCRVCNATLVLIRCLRGNQLSSFPYVNN